MGIRDRVNRLEQTPARGPFRVRWHEDHENPTIRKAAGGGYELMHEGEWLPRAEVVRRTGEQIILVVWDDLL
ncbi:MAG: hypothetical protein GVY12_03340 [Bacteroidetes bacterium]|jgi:hypothetical protein|nr:hypothetical protein [Bacteroidota bacterium]